VAGIDFAVREGELFGLLGAQRSRQDDDDRRGHDARAADRGRVLVDGSTSRRTPSPSSGGSRSFPQLSNLDRTLTAIENLTFHAGLLRTPRAERRARSAREVLAAARARGPRARQRAHYSGGMAQRLMIARALMHEPRLLILDEPTTGLDPQSRLFLWDTMLDLKRAGVTLVLTTHDMVEADRLCDRIAIMDHGRVIALDTPQALARLLPAEHGLDLVLEGGDDPARPSAPLDGGVPRRDERRGRGPLARASLRRTASTRAWPSGRSAWRAKAGRPARRAAAHRGHARGRLRAPDRAGLR
jgi:ABC-2 type transport system ATP-binding protein